MFIESSDDEVDELECEGLYDSTEEVEYAPQLESESSDINSDLDELPKRHCNSPYTNEVVTQLPDFLYYVNFCNTFP